MGDLQTTLVEIINNSDKDAIGYILAKTILDNYERIPHIRLYELAQMTEISVPTMRYFIKRLGFQSYNHMQETITTEMANKQKRYTMF